MTDRDEWNWIDEMDGGMRVIVWLAAFALIGIGVCIGLGLALWGMVG